MCQVYVKICLDVLTVKLCTHPVVATGASMIHMLLSET